MLARAVEEAARLLQADGAMVYLVDGRGPDALRGRRRHPQPEAQQLIRDLTLPMGVGPVRPCLDGRGRGVRRLPAGQALPHSDVRTGSCSMANMRSMAAAPLIADGEVLGALGAYSSRIDDFDEAEVALRARSPTTRPPRSPTSG